MQLRDGGHLWPVVPSISQEVKALLLPLSNYASSLGTDVQYGPFLTYEDGSWFVARHFQDYLI
jgi:hypothetical protein